MKRLWLLALPWAVVTSTYQGNCTGGIDTTTQNYGEVCQTKTMYAIMYNDQQLVCCGDPDSSCMMPSPCEWMADVTAAFNEMANARKARLHPKDGDVDDLTEPEPSER